MCFHNAMSKRALEAKNRFNAPQTQESLFEPIFHASAFTFPAWPIITREHPEKIELSNWGLIPQWIKTKTEAAKFRMNTFNAVGETAFEKPSFRHAIRYNRCLVLSTGFFEWRDYNKEKFPYFISLKSNEMFAMAGIYEQWPDRETGELFHTFSILTTSANPLMAQIHNLKQRMPVILPPGREKDWLFAQDQVQINSFLQPYPSEAMQAHTISKLITSRKEPSNVKEVQDYYEYPGLPQISF